MTYTATFSSASTASQTNSPIGYKLVTEITSVTGFADTSLFLLQGTTYAGICSPGDLINLSTVMDPVTQFVRANKITIFCPDADSRDEFIASTSADLKKLCTNQASFVTLSTPVITTVSE